MTIYYNDQSPEKIFYQGKVLQELGQRDASLKRFENLIHYGESHLDETVKIDFFAVSLPNLAVFDADFDKFNTIHCLYLMGLGYMGEGSSDRTIEYFLEVLKLEIGHQGAVIHLNLVREESPDLGNRH